MYDEIEKRHRKYDDEFKQNLLKLLEDGRTVAELESSFGVDRSIIYAWRRKAVSQTQTGKIDKVEDELHQLRSEVLRLRTERDILKSTCR